MHVSIELITAFTDDSKCSDDFDVVRFVAILLGLLCGIRPIDALAYSEVSTTHSPHPQHLRGELRRLGGDAPDDLLRPRVVEVLGDPEAGVAFARPADDRGHRFEPCVGEVRPRRQAVAGADQRAAEAHIQQPVELRDEAVRVEVVVPEPARHGPVRRGCAREQFSCAAKVHWRRGIRVIGRALWRNERAGEKGARAAFFIHELRAVTLPSLPSSSAPSRRFGQMGDVYRVIDDDDDEDEDDHDDQD